jgi:hypothetical protein
VLLDLLADVHLLDHARLLVHHQLLVRLPDLDHRLLEGF